MAKGLTKAGIVSAAFDVLDAGGIDAVTVRAVAARLGVQAPALYWHVRNKQELLDEMGTEIQRQVVAAARATEPAPDWREQLRHYADCLRREYLAHRDGARAFSGTRLTDPEVLRAQEPWLVRWVQDGIQLADAVLAAELVTAFVVGFVIEEQERAQSDDERYSLARRDEAVGPGAPLARRAGRLHATAPDQRFADQLSVILAGLATRFTAETSTAETS